MVSILSSSLLSSCKILFRSKLDRPVASFIPSLIPHPSLLRHPCRHSLGSFRDARLRPLQHTATNTFLWRTAKGIGCVEHRKHFQMSAKKSIPNLITSKQEKDSPRLRVERHNDKKVSGRKGVTRFAYCKRGYFDARPALPSHTKVMMTSVSHFPKMTEALVALGCPLVEPAPDLLFSGLPTFPFLKCDLIFSSSGLPSGQIDIFMTSFLW